MDPTFPVTFPVTNPGTSLALLCPRCRTDRVQVTRAVIRGTENEGRPIRYTVVGGSSVAASAQEHHWDREANRLIGFDPFRDLWRHPRARDRGPVFIFSGRCEAGHEFAVAFEQYEGETLIHVRADVG